MSYIGTTPLIGNQTAATLLDAVNAAVAISMNGNTTVAAKITAVVSPSGITIVGDASFDGGATWQAGVCYFTTVNGTRANSISVTGAGNAYTLHVGGGATHTRVRINARTSGSITVQLVTSNASESAPLYTTNKDSAIAAPQNVQIGGWDGSNSRTISTNNSGHINIADGGSSITVDGTVSVNALPAGTNNIGDVDILSIVPGTGATNLGKAEDGAHTSGDVGVMALAVRTDTAVNRSGADGDYEPLQISAGRVWTSAKIDTALPAGTNAIGKLSANDGVDIGDVTINNPSIAVTGTFWQTTQPVSGTVSVNALPAGSNNIGDVDVLSVIPGTGATNLGKAEDGAHATGDVGVMALAVRTDTAVNRSGADGDYEPLQISAGRVWTSAKIDTALPTGSNVIGAVTQSGTWTVQPGNTANTTPWLIRNAEYLGTATALGALNATVTQALTGTVGVAAVITATATPTGIVLTPLVSYDGGTNYVNTTFFDVNTGIASSTINAFTVGNSYSIATGDGATHVRVSATSWTSGSVTVRLSATNAQGLVNLRSSAVHDSAAGTYTQLISGFASSTAPTAVANGDAARIWTTTAGAVNIADGGGTISIDDGAGSITVDGTVSVNALPAGSNNIGDVDVISVIPGTGATNLGKAEDGAHTSGDVGVMALAVRTDTAANRSGADGDYEPLQISAGRLWTSAKIDTALPTGSNVIGAVTQSGTWTIQPGNTANTTPWLIRNAEYLGTATALGALNAAVTQALTGTVGVAAVITATATPTGIVLTPQASYDGGNNYVNTTFFDVNTGLASSTINAFTVGNSYSIATGDGATHVRVIATSWTSGSVSVRLSATNAQGLVNLRSSAVHDSAAGTYTQLVSGFASSTAPTAVANGDAARIWTTTAGAVNIADGGSSITVDGTVSVNALPAGTNNIGDVDVLSIVPGTGATNLGKAEDGAHTSGDVGVMALAVRTDTAANRSGADGDYEPLQISAGRLWTSAKIDTALPAGTNNIGAVTLAEYLGTATALGALNAAVTQALTGTVGVAAVITATATPTGIVLTPQASYDGGTNYVNTTFFDVNTGIASSTINTFAVGNSYSIATGDGATHVRVSASSWTSGSVTVRLSATNAQGLVNLRSSAVHDLAAGTYTQLISGFASSTAPTAVANGDAARIWTTTAGAVNIADGGSSITVDGTVAVSSLPTLPAGTNNIGDVDVLSVIPGTGATNLGKAEDGAHATGDVGVMALAVRTDTAANRSGADGDYEPLQISAGRLWTSAKIDTALPAGTNNIGAVTLAEYLGTATALGALNAAVTQALTGTVGVAAVITATSAPSGIVLTPLVSYDGGTNYVNTTFFDVNTGIASSTINTFAVGNSYSIATGDGATHVRVSATSWTSGSVTVRLSATNAQGLVNLRSSAVHDLAAGTYTQLVSGFASSTAPTAVANGDAARIWTTTAGAVNIADGGGTISIDDGAGSITVDGAVSLTVPTTGVLSNATTTAYASSLVVKASAGILFNITGFNSSATGQFIHVYNATSVPAAGAVPSVMFFVPPSSNFSFNLGAYGRAFSTGIVVGNSSTGPTKTLGAADCWFDVQYK